MNEFWFYIAAAEYVMIAGFLHHLVQQDSTWPKGRAEQIGACCALALWPVVYLLMIGAFIWRASLRLVSSLLSGKR